MLGFCGERGRATLGADVPRRTPSILLRGKRGLVHRECRKCGKRLNYSQNVTMWRNMFRNYAMITETRRHVASSCLEYNTYVRPDMFASIVRTIAETNVLCDDNEKFASDMLEIGNMILRDIYNVDHRSFKILSTNSMWDVIPSLLYIWFRFRRFISAEEFIDCYRVHLLLEDYRCAISLGSENDSVLSSMQSFYSDLEHDIPAIVERREMWELWYQNDPEVHKEGVGNRVVWLPREMVEDVISFSCIRLTTDGLATDMTKNMKPNVSVQSQPMIDFSNITYYK